MKNALLRPAVLSAMALAMNRDAVAGGGDREADALRRREPELRAMFEGAGLRWPAGEIFFRALKREGTLEVWARDRVSDQFRLVKTYPVLAQSGSPGPKRREGDRQVPEGFYKVDRFNPKSAFHLSLGLDYPNASDRILSDPQRPGSDIFIHGSNVSIGCLAMGDGQIEELYLAAKLSAVRPIRVHVFPARMDAPDWPAWRDAEIAKRPGLRGFWEQLAAGWNAFADDHRPALVEVAADGSYTILRGKGGGE